MEPPLILKVFKDFRIDFLHFVIMRYYKLISYRAVMQYFFKDSLKSNQPLSYYIQINR